MFVELENIGFSYTDEKSVLAEITFSVNKGETLAVVGPSGCGKSTLLRIIAGILPQSPDHRLVGKVLINGELPNSHTSSGKVAFMFQDSTLMPNLSVSENIGFPMVLRGIRDDARVEELIETVGLTEFADYLPNKLSGGMKTRVALARSFVTRPELLFLDEPFSALDIAWKSRLYAELEQLVDRYGSTVVFVTHDVQEALLLSNDVVVLSKDGRMIKKVEIQSAGPISARVNAISEFSKSDDYQTNFVAIQKWIMDDGIRSITGIGEVDRVINKLKTAVKMGGVCWPSFDTDIVSIRPFVNEQVYQILLDSFRTCDAVKFRYGLLWDILHYENVPDTVKREMRNFYLTTLAEIENYTLIYYAVPANRLFDMIIDTRIKGDRKKYPLHKLFIYLCDLFHSTETKRVLDYLEEVIEGKHRDLDNPIAKETATLIKTRIVDEKKTALHSL